MKTENRLQLYHCDSPALLTTAAAVQGQGLRIYSSLISPYPGLTGLLPPRWFIRFEHCALHIHIHLWILGWCCWGAVSRWHFTTETNHNCVSLGLSPAATRGAQLTSVAVFIPADTSHKQRWFIFLLFFLFQITPKGFVESDTSFDYTQNILNDNTIPRKPWHDYGSRNRWGNIVNTSLSSNNSFQLSH